MASITKTDKGYRAQIYVLGVRENKRFRTKREAEAWAAARETELRKRKRSPSEQGKTLADALTDYADKVADTKRGGRWEKIRIDAFLRDANLPTHRKINLITPDDIGRWRDSRLKSVAAGTVIRELGLLSVIFECARREWRWVSDNPVKDVRKPPKPAHREVVIRPAQIKQVLRTLNYDPRSAIKSTSQSAALAFLVAMRTGMRAGELCKLEWSLVKDDYCILPVTKTKPRNVPLTAKAKKLINKATGFDDQLVFNLASSSLDALFRRARDRAGLEGFTFHDSRHTAATWLAPRMDILDLCKMFGWSNPAQAMTYYNPTASQIAARIRA